MATKIDHSNGSVGGGMSAHKGVGGVKKGAAAAAGMAAVDGESARAAAPGADAPVKVEISEEGKRLAKKAGAAGKQDLPDMVERSPAHSRGGQSGKAKHGPDEELGDMVKFYAKKIAKAARDIQEKELSKLDNDDTGEAGEPADAV